MVELVLEFDQLLQVVAVLLIKYWFVIPNPLQLACGG